MAVRNREPLPRPLPLKYPHGLNKLQVMLIACKGRMEVGSSGQAWRCHDESRTWGPTLPSSGCISCPHTPKIVSGAQANLCTYQGKKQKVKGQREYIPVASVTFTEFRKACPVPSTYMSCPALQLVTTTNHKGGWEVPQFLSFLITEHIATLKK